MNARVESTDALANGKAGTSDLDYTWAERKARVLADGRHRAACDAAYWVHLLRLILSGETGREGTKPACGKLGRRP